VADQSVHVVEDGAAQEAARGPGAEVRMRHVGVACASEKKAVEAPLLGVAVHVDLESELLITRFSLHHR
jgi:hypothetical protein